MINTFVKNLLNNKFYLMLFIIIIPSIVILNRLGDSYLGGDDCYYSEVAKEMSMTGDYLTTRSAYEPNFHTSKPPMLFWMNALSGNILGFNSFAMRLPSALLGILGIAALFIFVRKYFDAYTALISALVLTFTQQYLYHARSAVTDGPFAVFFALALFCFWVARNKEKPTFYYLTGIFAGIAVMTRQIPGFFIWFVIAGYIVFAREWKILRNIHLYAGFLLSLAIIMPWHIIMYKRHGMFFIDQYLGVTLMTAFKGYPEGYSSNPSLNPWYAYAQILASNYEPWFLFLIAGFYQLIRNFKTFDERYRKKIIFILSWVFIPLAIFQAAKVKQYHYIMPIYVPLAVITAMVFNNFKENIKQKAAFSLIIIAVTLSLSYIFYPILPKTLDSREFNDTMLMLPEIRKIPDNIVVLRKGFSHYYNCLIFYADKNVEMNTEEDIIGKINSDKKYYFLMFNDSFSDIEKRAGGGKINVLKSSKDSILFTNKH